MNKVTKEVTDFEAKLQNEYKDWKTKLTGGLDNTQVFVSLGILGCFFASYTIINFTLGNTRDQYTITSGCYCRSNARIPYVVSFTVLLITWFIFHTYIFIKRTIKRNLRFAEYCCNHCNCRTILKCLENALACVARRIVAVTEAVIHRIKASICKYVCCDPPLTKSEDESPGNKEDAQYLNEYYENLLWYRYYKLYVVGYSKDIKPKTPIETKTDPPKNLQGTSNGKHSGYLQKNTDVECFRPYYLLWKLTRIVLVLLQYVAQGTTVPILMLQIFDTYALLCFSPVGEYCETVSEYKVHLAQAAITISFYFCVALAQLTSVLLEWEEKSDVAMVGKKMNDAPTTVVIVTNHS